MRTSVLLTIVRYFRQAVERRESALSGISSKLRPTPGRRPEVLASRPRRWSPPRRAPTRCTRGASCRASAAASPRRAGAERRRHGVEIRQRDGSAHAAEERAARKCLSGEDLHRLDSLDCRLALLFATASVAVAASARFAAERVAVHDGHDERRDL